MKKLILILLFIITAELSASTIIVNSIYSNDSISGFAEAANSVEDGLMDSLFDLGFIMFSTVNAPGYSVEGAEDARYMISIEPLEDAYTVSYTLQATVNGMVILSGIVDFSHMSGKSELNDEELYFNIGEEVAEKLKEFF